MTATAAPETIAPTCPDCGPLTLNAAGQITAHHCPRYSNLPSIDGVPHAQGPAPEPGHWELTGNIRVWHPARPTQPAGARA